MVLSVIRFAILVVLTLIVVSLVVALARPETGVIEKLFLAGGVLAVIVVAAPVRRIGAKA
jgi:tryptophan-rich sensory protein